MTQALADGADMETAALALSVQPTAAHLEISSTVTPSWDAVDLSRNTTMRPLRDAASSNLVQESTRVEISRWAQPAKASGVGLALGVNLPSGSLVDARTGPVLDVGVRWRSAEVNQRRLDIAAFRRVGSSPDAYTLIHADEQPLYAARVEMQFANAKSRRFLPELGAIGMQMNGGGKIVLRAKRGGPMLYYRAQF